MRKSIGGLNTGSPLKLNLKTLKCGATTKLPDDPQEAFNILLDYTVHGNCKKLFDLLDGNCISDYVKASTVSRMTASTKATEKVLRPTRLRTSSYSDSNFVPCFDINYIGNRHGQTLLHLAAITCQEKSLEVLIQFGADPNVQDRKGMSAVHIASKHKSANLLNALLDAGGVTHEPDVDGLLPIHWAVCSGSLPNVIALSRFSNDVLASTNNGKSCFHLAVFSGQFKVLEYLLKDSAVTNSLLDKTDKFGETPLISAANKGYCGCCDLLLENDIDLTCKSKDGICVLEILITKEMYNQAAKIARKLDNWIRQLEHSIEYNLLPVQEVCKFFEFIFEEHRDIIWDLWNDLRNLVIDCAKSISDLSKPVGSFPLFVRILKHLRSLGVMTVDPITSKNPMLKRMITFSPANSKQEEKLIFHRAISLETENISSHGEPSKIDTFTALDDIWKFLHKWMNLVKSYHSRTTSHRFMRRPFSMDADDLRDIAPQLCSLIKGYHIWTECTVHYKTFLTFVSKFTHIIKLFLTFNTELIFDSLDFLLDSPVSMIEFQNIRSTAYEVPLELRKTWFYDRLYQGTPPDHPEFLSEHLNLLTVDRDNLFSTSCDQIMSADDAFLRGSLTVNFVGDDGMGVGVRREWFNMILDHVTDPRFGLFQGCNNGLNFQPVAISTVNPEHLQQFEFAGKIIALLIYYKSTTGVHFTTSFYKQMLGEPLDFTDVASIDLELANSLHWIIDNDVSDIMELTFSIDLNDFGEAKIIDLKPNGRDILVSEENKVEYVRLLSEYKMSGSIKPQINSFLQGFYSIIPRKILAIFTPQELELVLCGLNMIDRRDFRSNVKYSGYEETDDIVQWFWEVLDSFNQDDLMMLLKFITGYTRVPHGGFGQLAEIGSSGPIKIVKANGTDDNLPKTSVCFNMLMLPHYSSKQILESKLRQAISYASIGFDQC